MQSSTVDPCLYAVANLFTFGVVFRVVAAIAVFQDVVGEVETFNYPRFLLEGFQFLGAAGESSLGGGIGDSDGFNDIVGETARTYTLQSG